MFGVTVMRSGDRKHLPQVGLRLSPGRWRSPQAYDNIALRYMWCGRTFRYFMAWFLIVAVLAICISPAVDLPETVLRSKQAALLLAMTLVAIATSLASLLIPFLPVQWPRRTENPLAPPLLSLDSTLPLLC